VGCTHCHLVVPGQSEVVRKRVFRKDISELCLECHEDSRENQINHRTGIKPSMKVPDDLHLGPDGALTCITCHQPHLANEDRRTGGRTYFLRRSLLKRELCLACHYEEKFAEPTTTFTIIAPVDNAIVKNLPVPFIAVASDDLATEASLFVNGSPLRLPVEHRTVSTLLTLQEGMNSLKLEAKRGKTATMTLLYSPTLPEDITYKLYYSHGILKKSDCRLCHPDGKPGAISVPDQVLCGKCHEGKNRLRFLHGPVAAGSCTVCHDPHGQTNRYFLVNQGEKLCLTCHTEK
jgi:predicted CXXCH cytochrome family protein